MVMSKELKREVQSALKAIIRSVQLIQEHPDNLEEGLVCICMDLNALYKMTGLERESQEKPAYDKTAKIQKENKIKAKELKPEVNSILKTIAHSAQAVFEHPDSLEEGLRCIELALKALYGLTGFKREQ